MIVFSINAVSADDLQDIDFGKVSGDVDVATANPWNTSGQLTYDVPAEAKEIKRADLYVNVYSGSAQNTYGANVNVSINTTTSVQQIASEQLWIEDGSADGTIYKVNDHINKCYSDYQMHYDLTDTFKGLNGSSISIKVDTFKMENKEFDGRIKLIGLILAYDDGDNDSIIYWFDSTQKWTKTNVTTTFPTEMAHDIIEADLINVALSSADGSYKLNGEFLGDADNHTSGNYYQYNYWNVTDKIKEGYNTELLSLNTGSGTYSSLKNVLTLLKIRYETIIADISFATEFKDTCYAGTNNVITIDLKASKAANYTVLLYGEHGVVNSTVVALDGENKTTILLTDPTIRPIDKTTVNGAFNKKVDYIVSLMYGSEVVHQVLKSVPVLYNGYLGKDMAYDATYIEDITIVQYTGNSFFFFKNDTTYASAAVTNRTDVFVIGFDENSAVANAFIYLAYNWDKSDDNRPIFNLTFNNKSIAPKAHYRDQFNLGSSGVYGYGLFVYDVSDLVQNGNNIIFLEKPIGLTAFYPSSLLCFLNNTGSDILCTAYIADGVDLLLASSYNKAGRIVKTDSQIDVDTSYVLGSSFAVCAAGAQKGEGNLIVNGVEYDNIWAGSSNGVYFYGGPLSNLSDVNELSFVATGGTILALNQIITTVKDKVTAEATGFTTEYTSVPCIYAGTNNTFSVDVKADKAANYTIELVADDVVVDSIVVALDGENKTTVSLTDPTIRPVDETTVSGANNTYVNYEVNVKYGDYIAGETSKTLPVLYNGYLGYDMEYNITGFENFFNYFTGDFVIEVKDEDTYLGSGDMNRTDVWNVNLNNSKIVGAIVIIPYNWFSPKVANETADMFNITFNGKTLAPMAYYRDQANIGNSGKNGYGVLVYNVNDTLIDGENTLVLNKLYKTPAVYPSTLAYWTNVHNGNFKEIHYVLGADLLANDYNKAGRTVKSDTGMGVLDDEFADTVLYVLAAGAQKGEGNILFNDKEYADLWNGSTKSVGLAVIDVSEVFEMNNYISFVSTGSTIMALPQFLICDAGYYFTIDDVKTEYSSVPCVYAGTNNTFTLTISTNLNAEFDYRILADFDIVAEGKVNLTNGTNIIKLTDPTIRPINETTVNGANNTLVYYGFDISLLDNYGYGYPITVPVLYNGYLGKDMEYNATFIEDFTVIQVTGNVIFIGNNDSTYLGRGDTERTDVWTVNLYENSTFVKAFVYLAYNWDKSGANGPVVNTTFNNITIAPKAHYRDQSNLGSSGKYGYGLLVYDVTDLIQVGNNTLHIEKPSGLTAFYPSNLIYFTNTTGSKVLVSAYIADGMDLLYNSYNLANRSVKTDSLFEVDVLNTYDNALLVYAAGAQAGECNIVINGDEYEDIWHGSSYSLNRAIFHLGNNLSAVNEVSFVSTGGTIVALNQILLTKKDIITAEASLSTEYKDTCFAGTVNVITAEVKADKKAEYTVELLADGEVVNSTVVSLDGENKSTVSLTDPTIRPIDETTVSGANNTKVSYAINVKYGSELLCEASKTVPVLYNGYLGKDMAYNATFIEDITVIQFTGLAELDKKEPETYLALADTNRTDVWDFNLTDKSNLVKGFVYLAYNWDKSGANGPIFNVTFNGKVITPKAHYRDQSNLGSSGVYGYGLFVYDVTDLVENGNNTFVLEKPSGLTAFYPSNFIYFTNSTSKLVLTAYLADGVDLLYNSYNKAGRIVKTDSQIAIDTEDMKYVDVSIFAAGAQSGEGNLIFNGGEFDNVWKGTDKGVYCFLFCDDNLISDLNNISFVSTGGTIVALNQIIIVTPNSVESEFRDIVVYSNASIGAKLVDADGKSIANEAIVYKVNGVEYNTTTNANGEFIVQAASSSVVEIMYAGNGLNLPVNTTITLKDLAPMRAATLINAEEYHTYAVDYYAGERGNYFKVQLVDADGNPLANKAVKIGFNGVVYTKETNATGWAELQINLAGAGTYTFAIAFLGDDDYNASFVVQKIVVTQKKTSISASAKSYKASASKSYTVTLKTDKGSSIDGKTYLKSGKKITLKINGKTYTAKTNSKGQATFKLSITKKGKYSASIKFEGDKTYAASSKSVKITIK